MVQSKRTDATPVHVLLVGSGEELVVVAQVWDFEVALTEAKRLRPDVVLVTRRLEPPFDGLQLTRALRWSDPGLAVVVVADRPDTFLTEQALLVGGSGVISPGFDSGRLARGLGDAVRGHLMLDEELRDAFTFEVEGEPEPGDGPLLRLIAAGHRTVEELSAALGRSWVDVERLLGGLQRRLGLASRVSLLLYADTFHRTE